MKLDRRRIIISAAGLAVGGITTSRLLTEEMLLRDRHPLRSRVAVISIEEYSARIEDILLSSLREFHLNLRGKSVLLKPNLVEYIPNVEVNTKPVLVQQQGVHRGPDHRCVAVMFPKRVADGSFQVRVRLLQIRIHIHGEYFFRVWRQRIGNVFKRHEGGHVHQVFAEQQW